MVGLCVAGPTFEPFPPKHLNCLQPHAFTPDLLADWDTDRTGALCALVEAMDQMPKRDDFVRQLREVCAYFEEDVKT